MALPKYKPSKSRTRRRKAMNMKLEIANLVECPTCGNKILRHRICAKCGSYRGKQVLEPTEMS